MSGKGSRFQIDGPAGKLEIQLRPGDKDGLLSDSGFVAIIAHPHPLYGGSMDNKVVVTLARGYGAMGVTTVCFNFRGVGASAGRFDEGRGEVDDFVAVYRWVSLHYPTVRVLVAGFSFGSAVAAAASHRIPVEHVVLVAPPVERYDYAQVNRFSAPVSVLIGGADERVDVARVALWFDTLQSPKVLKIMPEAGHFFHGQLASVRLWLIEQLVAFFEK